VECYSPRSPSIVTALVVGGIAWATIPAGDGTISACYDKQSGQVRIYDPSGGPIKPCGKTEGSVTWSEAGPKGDTGDTGPQGPSGISHAYHGHSAVEVLGTFAEAVVNLSSLPAGDYIVLGTTVSNALSPSRTDCALAVDLGPNVAFAEVDNHSVAAPISMLGYTHLSQPGTLSMICESDDATGNTSVRESHVVAIAIDAIN
jgi:hypothetical protein